MNIAMILIGVLIFLSFPFIVLQKIKKMKQEIDNPGNCITLKIENVDDSLFDMMNNETAIFDGDMQSDNVTNVTLTNFVREIIRQLGGNDNHVEDWVIELYRVEF